jgi:hypothetical protein
MFICNFLTAFLLIAPALGFLSHFDTSSHLYTRYASYAKLEAHTPYKDINSLEAYPHSDPYRNDHQLRARWKHILSYSSGNRISIRALTRPRPTTPKIDVDTSGIPVTAGTFNALGNRRSGNLRTGSTRTKSNGIHVGGVGTRNGSPRSRSSSPRRPVPPSRSPRTSTEDIRGTGSSSTARGSSGELNNAAWKPTPQGSTSQPRRGSPPLKALPGIEEVSEHATASSMKSFDRTLTAPAKLGRVVSTVEHEMEHSSNGEVKLAALGLATGATFGEAVIHRLSNGLEGDSAKKVESNVADKGKKRVFTMVADKEAKLVDDIHRFGHHSGHTNDEGVSRARHMAPAKEVPASVKHVASSPGVASGAGRGAPGIKGAGSGAGRGAPGAAGADSGAGRGAPGGGGAGSRAGRGVPTRGAASEGGHSAPNSRGPSEHGRITPTGNRPEFHQAPGGDPHDSGGSGSSDHDSDEHKSDLDEHQDQLAAIGQFRDQGLRPRPRPDHQGPGGTGRAGGGGGGGGPGHHPPQSLVGRPTRQGMPSRPSRPPKPKKIPKKAKSTKPWNAASIGLTTVGVMIAGGASVAGTIAQEKGAEASVKGADAAELSAQANMKNANAAQLSAEAGIESAHASTIIAEANVKSSNASKESADGTQLIAAVNYETAAHNGTNVTAAKEMAEKADRTNSKRKRSYPPVMLHYDW